MLGVSQWAEKYEPYVPCCSYKTTWNTKRQGWEAGAGHQFKLDMSRVKHTAKGGLRLDTKQPPQSHPVVPPKLWFGGISEK